MEEDMDTARSRSYFPSPSPSASPSDFDTSFTSTTSTARNSFTLTPTAASFSTTLLSPLPHHSLDLCWHTLLSSPSPHLHLQLLRHLGSGSLARVYHCRLHNLDFALKVVDTTSLPPSKLRHLHVEAHVLSFLDHPFLPTLYAYLRSPTHHCLLLDYCPGGDLHSLLHRRGPFPIPAARFFAAEILLALEYLHLHGFVYRDLKPENILLQSSGHLMLIDFDLCFKAPVIPRVQMRHVCRGGSSPEALLEVVAEPCMEARTRECVGTHEYVAPEVMSHDGHGNGVDWWAFGVLLYEMLYGRTPFKGRTKESTLENIRTKALMFPRRRREKGWEEARDLMEKLLVKDPTGRMGSVEGAAEIKRHPFFAGVRWSLIRSSTPPVVARGERRRKRGGGEGMVAMGGKGKRNVLKRLMWFLLGKKKKTMKQRYY